jgi:hypothetical protein
MKIRIELPDDLYGRAKSEAALRGCRIEDLVVEGLRLSSEALPKAARAKTLPS